mmetsp:Transcript_23012/g.45492  ORF Transcript_23012/g.45492 Transcript_23012/m.45492 type:complete len:236 (+) Transcript_23012:3099-3806(+)
MDSRNSSSLLWSEMSRNLLLFSLFLRFPLFCLVARGLLAVLHNFFLGIGFFFSAGFAFGILCMLPKRAFHCFFPSFEACFRIGFDFADPFSVDFFERLLSQLGQYQSPSGILLRGFFKHLIWYSSGQPSQRRMDSGSSFSPQTLQAVSSEEGSAEFSSLESEHELTSASSFSLPSSSSSALSSEVALDLLRLGGVDFFTVSFLTAVSLFGGFLAAAATVVFLANIAKRELDFTFV